MNPSSNTTAGSYRGSERRHHVVYTTRNSEYYCRDQLCVAVRDRRRGEFLPDHPAVGRRFSGAIRYAQNSGVMAFVPPSEPPAVGDLLFFSEGRIETEIQTTAVCEINRPGKEVVAHYLN